LRLATLLAEPRNDERGANGVGHTVSTEIRDDSRLASHLEREGY
jgi:hypothetical protein